MLHYNDPDDVFEKPDALTPLDIPLYRFAERYSALLDAAYREQLNWHCIKILAFLLHAQLPVNQQEIADNCDLNKALVVLAIDSLEGMHIVERRPAPKDRRVNLIAFKENGRQSAKNFASGAKRTEAKVILSTLNPMEQRQLERLL